MSKLSVLQAFVVVGFTVAGIVMAVLGHPMIALFLLLASLLVWILPPSSMKSTSGPIHPDAAKVDPRAAKQYRKEHPGTSIPDALNHLRQ